MDWKELKQQADIQYEAGVNKLKTAQNIERLKNMWIANGKKAVQLC